MRELSPVFLPVAELVAAFQDGSVSPVEVVEDALRRAEAFDSDLNAYLTVLADSAREQARAALRRYRDGGQVPSLLGVPVSVKDLFHVQGAVTTLGSLVYRNARAASDSAAVARLRAAGAVIVGKTNTAEFGHSATTENLLRPGCANVWDATRTAGGSSGGAATSVAAGMASLALGSDGGGSIRIPAAFSGLFGLKPTYGLVGDDAFKGMTDFSCPGPLVRRVADARPAMDALTGRSFRRRSVPSGLRIAWCPRPEGRPIDAGVLSVTTQAVTLLEAMGHHLTETDLPIEGWEDVFGPLVLAEEWRERRELLDGHADQLTRYGRRSIEAGGRLAEASIDRARAELAAFRERFARFMDGYDLIVTPATATVAFPLGARPAEIGGEAVDRLWGPFPFTAPFNVSLASAASLPCGLRDGMPVGLQVVAAPHADALVLDVCEELEQALAFPADEPARRWTMPPEAAAGIQSERRGAVAVIGIARPRRRNALTLAMLRDLRRSVAEQVATGARAIVLTGASGSFSSGIDLDEVGKGVDDVRADAAIAETAKALREAPVPVLAAIEGPCIGAGLDLALACDARIAGQAATFTLPAARLGLLYRVAGLDQLVRRAGYQTASRLVLLDERLDAGDALTSGLVARVVSHGTALEQAVKLAARTAACSPAAIEATKRVLVQAADGTLDAERWGEERRRLLASSERLAAVARARDGQAPSTATVEG